jgi:hypothetical protein
MAEIEKERAQDTFREGLFVRAWPAVQHQSLPTEFERGASLGEGLAVGRRGRRECFASGRHIPHHAGSVIYTQRRLG